MTNQPQGDDKSDRTIGAHTISEMPEPDGAVAQSRKHATTLIPSHQRFRVKRRQGEGGQGLVWIADDIELNREVAIKELRSLSPSVEEMERFKFEARITGYLNHPGVPPVHAMGVFEDGRHFYAMRLIEGKTLKQAIREFHQKFPYCADDQERTRELRKLLAALVNVCHTMRYAHSRQILHRDLKPSNIMLGDYGETLVLDWGLAKFGKLSPPYSAVYANSQHRNSGSAEDSDSSGARGTPYFMSPEQANGEWDEVNSRSDVYSLGATLYQLLSGKLPFVGATQAEVIESVKRGVQRSPREIDPRVPPELNAVCMKAMSLNREDRYASPGELASEIECWLSDEPLSSYREPGLMRLRRWLNQHQSAVAALAAVVTTGAVAVAIGFFLLAIQGRKLDKANRLASETLQQAEKIKDDARLQVVRILAVANNKRLSHYPGSELARIELLESVIAQLEQWCLEDPSDQVSRTELIGVLVRRSSLYRSVSAPGNARRDLESALRIISQLFESNQPELHSRLVLARLFCMRELGILLDQEYGPSVALAYLQPVKELVCKIYYAQPAHQEVRLAYASIQLQVADELKQLGRLAEAVDCLDKASSELDSLKYASLGELNVWLYNGPEVISILANEALLLQGEIACLFDDAKLASSYSKCVHRNGTIAFSMETASVQLLQMQARLVAIDAFIAGSLGDPWHDLNVLRSAAMTTASLASRVPDDRLLRHISAEMSLSLAEQEFRFGSLSKAESAVAFALDGFAAVDAEGKHESLRKDTWHLARAHRLQAEIAIEVGDIQKAQTHAFAARATLYDLPFGSSLHDDLYCEAMLIEQVIRIAQLVNQR